MKISPYWTGVNGGYLAGTSGSVTAWDNWVIDTLQTSVNRTALWVNASTKCDLNVQIYENWVVYEETAQDAAARHAAARTQRAREQAAWDAGAPERTRVQAAWDAGAPARRAAAEARAREARYAQERAEKLLQTCLTDEQKAMRAAKGFFVVQGRRSRYRIHQGTHGNIEVVNRDGRVTHRLCGQPSDVPSADANLAQKLGLELDEDAFLAHCNRSSYVLPNPVLPALAH
jgi:hypothetical protein